jgi:hypothetical protein
MGSIEVCVCIVNGTQMIKGKNVSWLRDHKVHCHLSLLVGHYFLSQYVVKGYLMKLSVSYT